MSRKVPINVTGPAYEAISKDIAVEECINFFHSVDKTGKKVIISLIGRFGLDLFSTIGAAETRAAINSGNLAYVISGDTFYSVDNGGNVTARGTLATNTGRVGIASNGYDVTMVDGVKGYHYLIATEVFTPDIQAALGGAGAGFPNGATDICYANHFYVVEDSANAVMNSSAIDDGLTWNALDYATPEADPDGIVRCMSIHGTVWALGESTAEPWYYAGDSVGAVGMPFLPNRSGVIDMGLAAKWSAAKVDNTLYWLAQNKDGIFGIVMLNGYSVVKVSTPAIDHAIGLYSTILDCQAFAFTPKKGHTFIVFTFPTANKTWVYDSATKFWSEWQSYGLGAFRCAFPMYFLNQIILGDRTTGKLYKVNWDTFTDAGDMIEATRTIQHISQNGTDVEFNSLLLFMETGTATLAGQGSDPKVMLTYSKDGGHAWSNRYERSMGRRGEYGKTIKWDCLGTSLDWVFRFKITDPVKRVITGAAAEVGGGID